METTQASFDRLLRENPMDEARKDALRLDFDRKLKLEFHGTKVTSDAGPLAYNLGNFLRRLVLPKSVKAWSLRTVRERLIKIGAKVIRHSRYVLFQMAEVAVPRSLFGEILGRIGRLRASPDRLSVT